jgi:molybdate transport system regulatory protein
MEQESDGIKIGFHLWIEGAGGHFLGRGRIELMVHIRETGSIAKAAKAMKMSYRQAWQMVADLNTIAGKPFVEKSLGGKGGGGAIVTKAGENAIKTFYRLEANVKAFIDKETKTMNL